MTFTAQAGMEMIEAARTPPRVWLAESRRFGWNFLGAFAGRVAGRLSTESETLDDLAVDIELGFYRLF